MMKKIFIALAAIVVSGCAINYTYDGKKYDSNESFQQAVDSRITSAIAGIAPLPAPVSKKKLIFAIPSESALNAESTARFLKLQGTQPAGQAREIIDNLTKSNHKNIKVFYDAVQKKNIYFSVQYLETQSMTGSFEASSEADTLYYVEPNQGSGQWFYHSIKGGKQIFAYDRSAPTPEGKIHAFVNAVLAQAVRD